MSFALNFAATASGSARVNVMEGTKHVRSFALLLIGSVAAAMPAAAVQGAAAQAAGGSGFVRALQACQQIQEPAARLSCFDRAAASLVSATSSGEVAVVDRQQVAKARRSLFGLSLPDIPLLSGSSDKEKPPKEIVTTLTAFAPIGNSKYRFTVEDGDAVWETTESASIYDPRIGAKVTIERGALGSYFAKVGSAQWVRARRVR